MSELPSSIRKSIPDHLLAEAVTWWRGLAEADRVELVRLCDARKEAFLFETFSIVDDNPRVTGGKFLPHDDTLGRNEWGEEYFDTLLSNAELMIVHNPTQRTFHIGCSRHPHARQCFQTGCIPTTFECPFHSEVCLMKQITGENSSIGLRPINTKLVNNLIEQSSQEGNCGSS
jgi:hypothetical protein